MDEKNNSHYEDAESQVNKVESNSNFNIKDNNEYNFKENNLNKFNKGESLEIKNVNDNKRYNNAPETNIILNDNINNDNSQLKSNYSSAQGFETKFEREKSTFLCYNCKCIIF